ncbi:MAG: DUF47 family protein [Syntrophales bacterium]|nr:DUF47 family protein [Syntrophales bacterium]
MIFIPKKHQFSDKFEILADKLIECAKLLLDTLNNSAHFSTSLSRITELEHEVDMITHNIYQDLHTSFMTPLDREDIYTLANEMDNIADRIESAMIKMDIYRIRQTSPGLLSLASILFSSVSLIREAIYAMRKRKTQASRILELCVEINSQENQADQILHQEIAVLFETMNDPLELLKWKDILENVEEATDICEDVSNILEGIILKYG